MSVRVVIPSVVSAKNLQINGDAQATQITAINTSGQIDSWVAAATNDFVTGSAAGDGGLRVSSGKNILMGVSTTEIVRFNSDGGFQMPGSTSAVSAVNTGRLRYNSSLQRFEASHNGGAYAALGGSGTVTGSGTTGKIPKWTGSTALGDSVITEISSSVVVNSTTATYKDTNGGGNITARLVVIPPSVGTLGQGGWGVDFDETDATRCATGSNYYVNNTSSNRIRVASVVGDAPVRTAGSETGLLLFFTKPAGGSIAEAMRIDASQNVGIGTTPATKFQVNGQASVVNGGLTVTTSSTSSTLTFGSTTYAMVIFKAVTGGVGGSMLFLNGGGGGGASCIFDTSTYNPGDTAAAVPAVRIRATDDGAFGNFYDIQLRDTGGGSNPLVSRMLFRPDSSRRIQINDSSTGTTQGIMWIRKDQSGGLGADVWVVNGANATSSSCAVSFNNDGSTDSTPNVRIEGIQNGVSGSSSDFVVSSWDGAAFSERMRVRSNGSTSHVGNANFGTTVFDYVGPSQYGALTFSRGQIMFSNTNTQNQVYIMSNAYINSGGGINYRNTAVAVGMYFDAGTWSIFTAASGSANSALTVTSRLAVVNDGGVVIVNSNGAAVSAANEARLRYNTGSQRLEVSENGAAYAALGGGISGSGTTNRISKFTASTAIGDSNISDTGTNIGMGPAGVGSTTGTVYIAKNTTSGLGGDLWVANQQQASGGQARIAIIANSFTTGGSTTTPTNQFLFLTPDGQQFDTAFGNMDQNGSMQETVRFGGRGNVTMTQGTAGGGTPPTAFKVNAGAHTNTARAEQVVYDFNAAVAVEMANGSVSPTLATWRTFVVRGLTALSVSGGVGVTTITKAATFAVTGAIPASGGNIVISNSYSIWAQDGLAQFDGSIGIAGSSNTGYAQFHAGQSAAVSASSTGRIRYNASSQRFEISENGGAYAVISTGGLSGSGTTNTIPKFTGTSTLGDSSITDNGTTVTISTNVVMTGNIDLGDTIADVINNNGYFASDLKLNASGVIQIRKLQAAGSVDGSNFNILGQPGGATAGHGGYLQLFGGDATGSNKDGGYLVLEAGANTGSGLAGKIQIGPTIAKIIEIGNAGSTIAFYGLISQKDHSSFTGTDTFKTTGAVQTTDATQTTVKAITLADTAAYWVHAKVSARETDGSNRALYERKALVYREGGGATIEGSVQLVGTDIESTGAGTGGWDVTITVSSNDVRVSVTGGTADTIDWSCTVWLQAAI